MELNEKKKRRISGDGSVYQDSQGRWIASLDVGTGVDGKRKRAKRTRKTKQEAAQALREMQAKKLERRLQSNERQTVNDLYSQWETYGLSENLRESTRQDYIFLAKRYVLPALGKMRLVDVDTNTIDRWIYGMKKMGYSAQTRKKARQNAFSIFKYGIKQRIILINPVAGSVVPNKDEDLKTQVKKPLNKVEWMDYLDAFRKTDLDTFVHVGALLGLRRSEIIGLNWSDVDFDEKYLHVRRSAREVTVRRPDGSSSTSLVLNDPKTMHSRRKLVMNQVLIDALKRQLIRQKEAKLAAGSAWTDTGAVFTTSIGTRLYPSNVFKRYKKLTESLGLRYVRIHDLRHTVAVLLLDDEIPLESVSRLLGHSSLSITMDIYARNVQSVADRGAKGMADLYEKNRREIKTKRHHASM
jgi:integrase